jgi:hypothetical protein
MRVAEVLIEGCQVRISSRAGGVEIRVENPWDERSAYARTIGGAPVLAEAIVAEVRTAIDSFNGSKLRSDANWAEVEKAARALGGEWVMSEKPS